MARADRAGAAEGTGDPMGEGSASPRSLRDQAAQLSRAADRFSLLRLRIAHSIARVSDSEDPGTRSFGEQIRAHWSAEEYAEIGRIAVGLRASARRLLEIAVAQERASGKRMGGYQGAGFLGRGEAARERVGEVAEFAGSLRGASIGGFPIAPSSGTGETGAFMPHASHALGAPTPDYEEE